jgi:D-glycero-D-manno-heptose 1,7-bisphosphate phosphatase
MLVILDKDGTLVEPASGAEFVQSPTDQRLLLGVKERISELKELGATIVIASNQGGVAAGHKSLADAIAEMRYCLELLPEIETGFFAHTYEGDYFYAVGTGIEDNHCHLGIGDYLASAPALEDYSESELFALKSTGFFRKPQPGMLLFAMKDWADRDAIMVGDRPEDRDAAAAAGIPFVDAEAWRSGAAVIAAGGFVA